MTFPPLTMRELDRVCGEVLRPDWAVRTDTKLPVSLPAKVYPWAAEIHSSRLRARSVCFSEEGEAVTLTLLSPGETSLTIPSFSPKKKDNTSDNMSVKCFINANIVFFSHPVTIEEKELDTNYVPGLCIRVCKPITDLHPSQDRTVR